MIIKTIEINFKTFEFNVGGDAAAGVKNTKPLRLVLFLNKFWWAEENRVKKAISILFLPPV